jgi:hypothetical protein
MSGSMTLNSTFVNAENLLESFTSKQLLNLASAMQQESVVLKMTDIEARKIITNAGASVKIFNTSLENINVAVIEEMLRFIEDLSNIEDREKVKDIVITGGTEAGHLPGENSHETGHKVDLRRNLTIDNFIEKNFSYFGIREDGYMLYVSSSGALYAKEGNHWDVLVY